MKFNEVGITERSVHYFYSPSPLSRSLQFYPTGIGHFYVEAPYMVRRMDFGCYLLLCVLSGDMRVSLDGRESPVPVGSATLIDCHKPHGYWTRDAAEFVFVHFDGATSAGFYDAITRTQGHVFALRDPDAAAKAIGDMLALFEANMRPDDARLGVMLYSLLNELLANDAVDGRAGGDVSPIDRATAYIHAHLGEAITVGRLAEVAGFSEAYFGRRFRAAVGMTPYHYILTCRIDRAKHLLNTTDMPVQRIALELGFGSAENFINAFKKATGLSPLRFRKMPL